MKTPQRNPAKARMPISISKKHKENMYGIDHCQVQFPLAKSSDQANMQPKLQRQKKTPYDQIQHLNIQLHRDLDISASCPYCGAWVYLLVILKINVAIVIAREILHLEERC
jgi:hypothetical protein